MAFCLCTSSWQLFTCVEIRVKVWVEAPRMAQHSHLSSNSVSYPSNSYKTPFPSTTWWSCISLSIPKFCSILPHCHRFFFDLTLNFSLLSHITSTTLEFHSAPDFKSNVPFFFSVSWHLVLKGCSSPDHFSDLGSSSTCLRQFNLMPTSVICLCLAGLDSQSEIPNPPIKPCAVWALRFKQTVKSEDIFKLMGFIYPLDFLMLSWFLWRPANPPARLQSHAAGRPHTSFKGIPRETGAPWSHYIRISRNRNDRCSCPISKWGQLYGQINVHSLCVKFLPYSFCFNCRKIAIQLQGFKAYFYS